MNPLLRSAALLALVTATTSAMALTKVQTATSSFSFDTADAGSTSYGPFSFDSPILALSPSEGVLTAVDVTWDTTLDLQVYRTYVGYNDHEVFGGSATNALSLGSVSLARGYGAAGRVNITWPAFTGGRFSASGSVSGSATDLTPFVGTGLVSPAMWTSTVHGVGTETLLNVNFAGTVSGTATDTYTYTPVPEPATLAALGLGAVALLKRRKRA